MYVLKSDSLFENERFLASIPPFNFVFFLNCSVSKEGVNNYGLLVSTCQNAHISRRASLPFEDTMAYSTCTPWEAIARPGAIFQPSGPFNREKEKLLRITEPYALSLLRLLLRFLRCETLISTYPWVPKMKRSTRSRFNSHYSLTSSVRL